MTCTNCKYKYNCCNYELFNYVKKTCFIFFINRISIANFRRIWRNKNFVVFNSLRYINEIFFYKLSCFDKSSFDNLKFINVTKWVKKLKNHENREFFRIFCEIFIFNVKIEYFDLI